MKNSSEIWSLCDAVAYDLSNKIEMSDDNRQTIDSLLESKSTYEVVKRAIFVAPLIEENPALPKSLDFKDWIKLINSVPWIAGKDSKDEYDGQYILALTKFQFACYAKK